ncbi:MAG: hypothetical protein HOY69_32420, partial [Streptomyces sp.]|nr:hypothetical protein [Streptomyces sp.]
LAWGLWADTSTLTQHLTTHDHQRLTTTGIHPLTTPHALTLLTTTHTTTHPHLIPAHLTLPSRTTPTRPGGARKRDLAAKLAGAAAEEREGLLLDLIVGSVAEVLQVPDASSVDPHRGFMDLGFSSLTAVELRNKLTAASGLWLPTTTIFDYPTAPALARFMAEELARSAAAPESGEGSTGTAAAPTDPNAVLDQLEAALAAGDGPGAGERVLLADRLMALLAKLDADGGPGEVPFGARDLSTASDDEIFDIIDGGQEAVSDI